MFAQYRIALAPACKPLIRDRVLFTHKIDYYLSCTWSCRKSRSHWLYVQLFRERLSEKAHATIPKGIVGGFGLTVLQT